MWSWLAAGAAAQDVTGGAVPELNAQTFRPSIDGDRMLWLDDAGKRPDQRFVGRFLLQYVADPLVYRTEGTDGAEPEETRLVGSVFQADLLGGGTVGPLRLGMDVPVYLYAGSDVVGGEAGLGDVAADAKFTALDGPSAPVDLALNVRVAFPTATVTTALGSPSIGWEIAAIASRELGPVLLAANLGTHGGPAADLENVELNDSFVARLGGSYAFTDDAGAGLELAGQLPYSDPANLEGSPFEVMASGYSYASRDVVVRGGIGRGLGPGIGAPDVRLVLGVGLEPRAEESAVDTDGDGLVDTSDNCPTEPEDEDGFQDRDGCPDLDNDQDGILDVADQCVDVAEDRDQWKDDDGCPDPKTLVKVVIVDQATKEPVAVAKVAMACGETRTGGTLPVEVEVAPGTCTVAATAAGYQRGEIELPVPDGPPVEARLELEPVADAKVVITRERIELRETIRFETGKAVLKPPFGALDEAAQILLDYPEIKQLRIEGHTDERGPDDFNLKLSRERARAVLEYFVSKGVDASRLSSEGFGESRPVDPGHTEAAWAKNRRTDFFIDVWEAVPVETTAPAPQ